MTKMTALTPIKPTLGIQEVSPIIEQGFTSIPQLTPHTPRVAVLVAHGMGQQVPYETIEDVVQAIQKGLADKRSEAEAAAEKTGNKFLANAWTFGKPEVRSARLGTENKAEIETELVRAEVKAHDENGIEREVHVYEAYWAPLTEGKVTIGNVMAFLWDAGWTGFVNTSGKTFRRWMFGEEREFSLNSYTLFAALFAVVLLLGSLTVINGVAAAAAASRAIGSGTTFPSRTLLPGLTWDFVIADVAIVPLLIGIFVFGRFKNIVARAIAWSCIFAGGALVAISALLMCLDLAGKTWIPQLNLGPRWTTFVNGWPVTVFVLWTIEIIAAYCVRWLLIEYAGDVAAYISGTKVSKFWELRQQIWNTCMKVARTVYRAKTTDANRTVFLYEKVVVVGHSLGSVIAYDLLNGLLMEEKFSKDPLNIPSRTPMFLTFGSPLDKTAFFFRTQQDMNSPIREVGAAAVQPMIQDYVNRPAKWINLWSKSDIICGELDYYDLPNQGNARCKGTAVTVADSRAIQNIIDPDATMPLGAHVEYWKGKLFAKYVVEGIFG